MVMGARGVRRAGNPRPTGAVRSGLVRSYALRFLGVDIGVTIDFLHVPDGMDGAVLLITSCW